MQAMGLLDPESVPRLSRVERALGPPYHFPEAFEILGAGEINRPLPWKALNETQQAFQAKKMAIHAAMVHRMDLAIGRVLDQLRQMDAWDNTLILFLSDNGASAEIMVRGDGHDPQQPPGSALTYLCLGPGWSTTSNTPFRRHKTWTHEGGIATPMILSWPLRIHDRGSFRRQPHHVIDVAATLRELTGAPPHPDAPPSPGRSFLDDLDPRPRGEQAKQGSEQAKRDGEQAKRNAEPRTLWWYHDGHRALRRGDWKAVAPQGEPWELYDLSTDRVESVDLAIPQADRLQSLVAAWEQQLEETIELASRDLSEETLAQQSPLAHRTGKMWDAQQAARIKRQQVLFNADTFRVRDRHAFVMKPDHPARTDSGKAWIFYGPALSRYPDQHEAWMHQQFLEAGVAVAGIDVGEAYGSPHSQPFFDALYEEMVARGYSKRPALFGRSRGGLYVSRFAVERPQRVAGIGGIYPVFDYMTYPGPQRAAAVYGMTPEQMEQRQDQLNPIRRAGVLAQAEIPVHLIHGADDQVVPLAENSAALEAVYARQGKQDLITLERVPGQGHNFWPGFFRSQPLVDFLIAAAKGELEPRP
jgi:hypothetical protein